MKLYIQIKEITVPVCKAIYMRRTGAYGNKNRELMKNSGVIDSVFAFSVIPSVEEKKKAVG